MPDNEVDTCRKFIVPKLQAAGWDDEPHSITEQRYITPGRIIPREAGHLRKPGKRVDYLLRHRRDFPLAVEEIIEGDFTRGTAEVVATFPPPPLLLSLEIQGGPIWLGCD